MSEQPPVITLRSITKRFGIGDAEHFALNGVDLTIQKGEFIAIMGPSGCGKTTLLNIIGLLDRATDGDYLLDGKSVEYLSARRHARIRSEYIGFVFQNFNLIPRLTIIENVALPLTYKGVRKIQRLERASRILKNFHLQEREYYMPHQLSGGQAQRVAIARALVNNPSIILADEPTGNLDSKTSHIIMEELSEVHRRGNTIIMVTHNPDLTSYASRVITMLDGKINTDSKDHKPLVTGAELHRLKKPLNESPAPSKLEKEEVKPAESAEDTPSAAEDKPQEVPQEEPETPTTSTDSDDNVVATEEKKPATEATPAKKPAKKIAVTDASSPSPRKKSTKKSPQRSKKKTKK